MTTMLSIEKREATGKKVRTLRTAGKLPAVLYGPKEPSTPVSISEKDFLKAWKEAGESTVIDLAGVGEDKEALIHEVDVDPVTGRPRHVDFYVIEKGKKVQVSVPLEFTGESPAVKNLGATLVKVLHEVEVEAMPKELPHEIVVDVSSIVDFQTPIHIRDLKLPPGVEVLNNPEDTVVLASEVEEEPEEPVAAPDLESIEVEKKGKEAAEGAEGGEAPTEAK